MRYDAVSPIITERVIGLVVLMAVNVVAIYLTDSVNIITHGTMVYPADDIIRCCYCPDTYRPAQQHTGRYTDCLNVCLAFVVIGFLLRMERGHTWLSKTPWNCDGVTSIQRSSPFARSDGLFCPRKRFRYRHKHPGSTGSSSRLLSWQQPCQYPSAAWALESLLQ